MSHTSQHMEAIREQARDWVLELSSGDIAGEDLKQFQVWVEADPLNRQVFNESQRVWDGLSAPLGENAASAEAILSRYTQEPARPGLGQWLKGRLRSMVWTGGAVAAAALVVAVMLPGLFEPQPVSKGDLLTTQVAEIRDVELVDGSVVTLGAKSSVLVDFDQGKRRIQLIDGQAFFDVAGDENRPFVVASRGTEVRVLGTQFDVRKGAEQLRIAVREGLVEVTPGGELAAARLAAGQQVKVLVTGEMTAVEPVTGDQPGDWRSGRLFYEGELLREVIADANRYHEEQILLVPHTLGELKVTASFRIDHIDQMLSTLQLALPIEVARVRDGSTVLIKQAREK